MSINTTTYIPTHVFFFNVLTTSSFSTSIHCAAMCQFNRDCKAWKVNDQGECQIGNFQLKWTGLQFVYLEKEIVDSVTNDCMY